MAALATLGVSLLGNDDARGRWQQALLPAETHTPHEVALYPGQPPGNASQKLAADPTLVAYPCASPPPGGGCTAIIIAPGGSFQYLALDIEGTQPAERFNSWGYSTFVLKYRTPLDQQPVSIGLPDPAAFDGGFNDASWRAFGPLMDLQRAVKLVRANADKWAVNASRVGTLGFSASGAIVGALSHYWRETLYPRIDAVDDTSAEAQFSMLLYPAYFFPIRKSPVTPPTFIGVTLDDWAMKPYIYGVGPDKCVSMFERYRAASSNATGHVLHVFDRGGHSMGVCDANGRSHGVGLAPADEQSAPLVQAAPDPNNPEASVAAPDGKVHCNMLKQGCAADGCRWPAMAAAPDEDSWLSMIAMR